MVSIANLVSGLHGALHLLVHERHGGFHVVASVVLLLKHVHNVFLDVRAKRHCTKREDDRGESRGQMSGSDLGFSVRFGC